MGGYLETYAEPIEVPSTSILVTRGEAWTTETFEALRRVVAEGTLVVHLAGDETIETLNEEQMRAHGWVRA